ncbi:T9SS type A sorting domain-containing protein [Massilibacteroides sp.]|uniref:T9SS type A sorting domain-containing protein n=1 Tax=Massilibacteroides sp. TaxID=2034766 RepID=UPI002633B29E|nr:T9SS type A sorting domain-containing protein [Massilibacteroides sp.]MDD4515880.1 T9SS type A sorting domain-containing protein [Massilibacteroides sp.]
MTDTATGIEVIDTDKPSAHYVGGHIWLSNLAGYRCTIFNLNGQPLRTFTVSGPEESHITALPAGLYILSAENGTTQIAFKLRITNQ